jgi:two-component system cell cycle response regulator
MARILVIEDNPANLELMIYLLRAYSYDPLSATDGERGLELARSARPDVVVCDIQLPGMDGFEVVRRLKADAATRAIPVVAVTAFAMVGDRDRALAAGFDGYIGKPIVPETFVPQVEQFLDEKSPGRPPPSYAASVPAPDRALVAPGARILIVDNTPANLDLMTSLLRPLGYEVITASSVDDALVAARGADLDLIISDVHMPERSGFDFLATAKADPELREVPFMLASATSWEDSIGGDARRMGADLFLMRPMDLDKLLAKVQGLLAAHAGKPGRA